MLWLKRLEVEGFGPFAERQVIDFPAKAGVTVVYGENMRGKTSLTNAIRYAFLGAAVGRGSRPIKTHAITNRERASHGQFGFSVALTFDFDGAEYELVRQCVPIATRPKEDGDYRQEVMLRRGTSPLGPQETDRLLQQIFPKEISRFFLFDGELLQEYEELLINESEAGHQISGAIERILGVPILKRARAHLRKLADSADREAAREASKEQNTQALGNALAQATDIKDEHLKEIQRLEDQLEHLNLERSDIEQYLNTRQRYASLLQELDAKQARLKEITESEKSLYADLQASMADGWRTILRETVRSEREMARIEAEQYLESMIVTYRTKAAEDAFCGVCDRPLDEPAIEHLKSTLPSQNGNTIAELSTATMARLADLNKFREADTVGEAAQLWKQIRSLEFETVSLNDEISDLRSQLKESDPEMIRRNKASYSDISERISAIKTAIQGHRKKLDEQDQNIQRIKRLIDESGSTQLHHSQLRSRVLTEAADVFDSAVEAYKSSLRAKVEQTASNLFLMMTTEKQDYEGLTINEGYGLTIRHRDGRAEEARSAGAEHVVALALMGALQKNAPLRGPIVMDSPFGRLDEGHTGNVVQTLPEMADQTVLLVYESEVRKSEMRTLLGSALLKEYELERVNARNTRIREVR